MPESRISSGELKITQSNLHEKGCQLTKVWSDLFSLLSKYQADLMVKENEIEVLEQQLESRQQMMKSSTDNDTREVTNLQGELQAKDLELAKYRADLLNSEEAMQRLQKEMRSNSELLTQCRAEVLENQEKLIKTRSELDKLRFELSSKDEQIRVKDLLLTKVQAQMMKEVSELSADVNSLKHQLNLEKTAHDETKKTLLSMTKHNQRTDTAVISIPDSPPMMDLSCDTPDDISSVSKANESYLHSTKSSHSRLLSSSVTSTPRSQYPYQRHKTDFLSPTMKSEPLPQVSNAFSISTQSSQSNWTPPISSSASAVSRPPPEQNETDVFSALSVDNKDNAAAFKTEDGDPVPVSLSGPLSDSFDDNGHSLGMDSSQMHFRTTAAALPNPHGWLSFHQSPQRTNKVGEKEMTPEERLQWKRQQATERQRRHRAKLRNDPQKMLEVKQRQKNYAQKRRILIQEQFGNLDD